MTTGKGQIGLLLLALASAPPAWAACGAIGARYVPRSTSSSPDIRYRMTILPLPRDVAIVAERYRFELFSRRNGRRLSRIDLDNICGNGRAPCSTWQPGRNEKTFFTSVVIRLNADFSPVHDWRAAYAIVFPDFSENDWTTPLMRQRYGNVRYFSRPHVEPDLSDHTIWVRTACGR